MEVRRRSNNPDKQRFPVRRKKETEKSKHGGQKEVGNGSGEQRKVEGGRLDWGSKEKE